MTSQLQASIHRHFYLWISVTHSTPALAELLCRYSDSRMESEMPTL